jgi:hypothetical protein
MWVVVPALASMAALLLPAPGGAQLYELTPVAVEGGSFTALNRPAAINGAGDVVFYAGWSGGGGIFLASGGSSPPRSSPATRVSPELPALSPPALGALVGALLSLGLLAATRAASRRG